MDPTKKPSKSKNKEPFLMKFKIETSTDIGQDINPLCMRLSFADVQSMHRGPTGLYRLYAPKHLNSL